MKWMAYCTHCKKELVDRCENGSFAETAAKIHAEETDHHIIVGYEIVSKFEAKLIDDLNKKYRG